MGAVHDTFGVVLRAAPARVVEHVRGRIGLPDGILERIRWAFLMFTGLVIGLGAWGIAVGDLAVWPSLVVGGTAYALLLLWATWLFRAPHLPPAGHAGGPALALVAGLALQGESTIGLVTLGVVCLHVLSVGRRVAVPVVAAYLVGSQLTAALTPGPMTFVADARAGSTVIALVLIAALMQFIREFALTHERLVERERLLTEAGSRILAASDLRSVHEATVTGAWLLAGTGSTVSLWRGDEHVRRVAGRTAEAWLPVTELRREELPAEITGSEGRDVPWVVSGEHATRIQERLHATAAHPACTVVPLGCAGGTRSTLVVGHDHGPDEDLVDVLRRFAVEASLALERTELTVEVGRRAELLRALIDNSSDVIMLLDAQHHVSFASSAVEEVLGVEPDRILGGPFGQLLDQRDRARLASHLERTRADRERHDTFACQMRRHDGERRHVEIAITRVAGPGPADHVLNIRDVTERRALEEEVHVRSSYDSVTGLANRALFMDRLERALVRSEDDGRLVGLAVLDLDDFMVVNDNLGHDAGDTILRGVGERLRSRRRPGETAARLGGDEFGLLLEDLGSPAAAHARVQDVLEALREPISVSGRRLPAPASAGLVLTERGEVGADVLLRHATLALYAAKDSGKARYEVYNPSMSATDLDSLQLRADMQQGLRRDEFSLSYQPIVDMGSREVLALEALLRWHHPTRGAVPPDAFIPLAESSRLIVPLGAWVLDRACQDVARWNADRGDQRPLELAVNVSAVQFHDQGLAGRVAAAMTRADLDPGSVVLEITETALMHDAQAAMATIAALKELGVRVAIDDFGTGYSSLGFLNRFPVDLLKIDREFVAKVTHGPEDAAIANAIVKLANTLGIEVVAEGVETVEQTEVLLGWGCRLGQGYRFAPPLPARMLPRWLRGDIAPFDESGHGEPTATIGGRADVVKAGPQDGIALAGGDGAG